MTETEREQITEMLGRQAEARYFLRVAADERRALANMERRMAKEEGAATKGTRRGAFLLVLIAFSPVFVLLMALAIVVARIW